MGAPKGNKYALGNNGGRPPVFENIEELDEKIDDYFSSCVPEYDDEGNLLKWNYPTITGLALYLGFASRQSIYDYESKKEFSYSIKRALMVIENHYEERLNFQQSSGSIFALKNMGWKDKIETEGTTVTYNAEVSKEEAKKISEGLEDEY